MRMRLRVAGLSLAALLGGAPGLVAAHPLVLESVPKSDEVLTAAPSRIFLRFNSRIEKRLSTVSVTGSTGRPVPLPAAVSDASVDRLIVPLPPLTPGRYLVRWKVLSADGHVTEGGFRFTLIPSH